MNNEHLLAPTLPFLKKFFTTLEGLSIPYLVGGSFASGAWGIPRQTNDLDLSLKILEQDIPAFVAAFQSEFSVSGEEIRRTLEERDE